ncbi:TYRAAT2 [Symbiodinium necroappetens]|uniref:TYRAAT2 protein n=1 Tax=Symbiodinium necroappetens TaxID=1628268 RepID=A0A812TCI7_9DINO|nr:TYRAAT2 [Symbiodinium necroappetens]
MARYTVAFQGESGAYSEQAVYELLGRTGIQCTGYPSFDDAFTAVSTGKMNLLMVPIENTLGGTIHANCDLQLQHNLFIIAEHSLRVRHALLALPGTKKESLAKAISHPQALAQCSSYLKKQGIVAEAAYDTAGSAKLIAEGKLEGVAAICSELAAEHYGLEVLDKGVEDDDNNFTRFLLLRSEPVSVPPGVKCKTSVVFSLENMAGSLFKALSVFALREIDLTKIESRPCKPDIMSSLERLYMSMRVAPPAKRARTEGSAGEARFRYLFYVDFLANVDEHNVTNALRHLQEMTVFFRVLGSFPQGGARVGLAHLEDRMVPIFRPATEPKKRIGVLGFGTFGQFIGKKLALDHFVFAASRENYSAIAANCGVTWCDSIDQLLDQQLDVLIISVSILSFEGMVRRICNCIASKDAAHASRKMLVVDVLSVKVHAKTTLAALLPETCDILCTHPMFGPQSGKHGWSGLPFVFERVRLNNARRCEEFLKWWTSQGCRMVDMTCELHDEVAAGSQFVTHFTGRVLERLALSSGPINTKGFESLLQLVENTSRDSFDLFYALFKFNPNSSQQLSSMEQAVQDLLVRSVRPRAFVASEVSLGGSDGLGRHLVTMADKSGGSIASSPMKKPGMGCVLGMIVMGPASDYIGRRLGLILCAMAWNENALIAARIITGLGMGGESPLAAAPSAECSEKTSDGARNVALLYLFG